MKRMIVTLTSTCFLFTAFAQEIDVPQRQYSLVTELTATWCPICGGSAWDVYDNLVKNMESKAVVLAAHYSSSSDLHSTAAYELINGYKGSPAGQPIFYFNRDKVSSNVESEMTTRVNNALAAAPLAQTGIRMEFDPVEKELVVRTRTEFFRAVEGEFFLSVLLLEKEVVASQAARGSSVVHKRVLRKSLTSKTLGDALASGQIGAGASFDLTVRTPMNSILEADKYQAATILWQKTADARAFVNANVRGQLDAFTTPAFAVESEPVSLTVLPNPLLDRATVKISGSVDLGSFQLNVYSVTGRLLKSWRENNFSGREFAFELDRNLLPQAGVYFLQLIGEKAVLGQKVVVR